MMASGCAESQESKEEQEEWLVGETGGRYYGVKGQKTYWLRAKEGPGNDGATNEVDLADKVVERRTKKNGKYRRTLTLKRSQKSFEVLDDTAEDLSKTWRRATRRRRKAEEAHHEAEAHPEKARTWLALLLCPFVCAFALGGAMEGLGDEMVDVVAEIGN